MAIKMRKVSQDELNEIIRLHGVWLREKIAGAQADLSDCDLTGANMRGVDLSRARFNRSIMRHADLSDSNLTQATMINVDLTDSYMSCCNLTEARMTRAKLKNATMRHCTMIDTILRAVDLADADLHGSTLVGVDFSHSNLRDVWLESATMLNCELREVIGNGVEIKTFQTESYMVNFTKHDIQIGCKRFTVEEWTNFTDHEISQLDTGALDWWKQWKDVVLSIHSKSF